MKSSRGFTLIELIVVVAVIGILGAIAYPAYTDAVRKSNRSAAQAALLDVAQRQQQYLLDNRSYAPDVATLNVTLPDEVSRFYNVTTTPAAGPPPSFTATATPKGTQSADGWIKIDSAGAKTSQYPGKW